jgi:response regulator RpfG family c-di-GMP phosphodiesterase
MNVESPGIQRAQAAGHRILDRLRDEGRLSAIQYESLYRATRRSGEIAQDAIIEAGAVSEAELLKFLATTYKTRFVSSERLAKASVDRALLELVPHRLAERLFCVPILHDKRASSLSIVVPDLEDDVAKQVQLVAGVREVHTYIARPASIRAAMRKFYFNDPNAFGVILASGSVGQTSSTSALGEIVLTPGGPAAASSGPELGFEDFGTLGGGGVPKKTGIAAPRTAAKLEISLDGADWKAPEPAKPVAPPPEPSAPPAALLDVIGTLVSLLEHGRGELRGHSALVARITRRMCDRLRLPASEIEGIVLAAAVHDLGNTTSYHLTALNVAKFDGHRIQAEKSLGAAMRLLDGTKLPPATKTTLESLHERWDGEGLPARKKGEDIPIGARIVSMVETYADLVANAKNPYRRVLQHSEATDVVRQLCGTLFDPSLIDGLRLAGSSAVHGGFKARARVLVVEPDADEATALEMRFSEQGATVFLASSVESAEKLLGSSEKIDLVVTEVDLAANGDGFTLVNGLKRGPQGDAVVVFVAKRHDRATVNKGLELGAVDYVAKPVLPEVVVSKAMQAVEAAKRKRQGGGLSGSIRDMGLPEVIQVLGQTRKTGVLRISHGTRGGEVHLENGQIIFATFGSETGEESFFRILLLIEGEFVFDASAKPGPRVINASTESLLLEGMRRFDEGTLA